MKQWILFLFIFAVGFYMNDYTIMVASLIIPIYSFIKKPQPTPKPMPQPTQQPRHKLIQADAPPHPMENMDMFRQPLPWQRQGPYQTDTWGPLSDALTRSKLFIDFPIYNLGSLFDSIKYPREKK